MGKSERGGQVRFALRVKKLIEITHLEISLNKKNRNKQKLVKGGIKAKNIKGMLTSGTYIFRYCYEISSIRI